MTAERAISAILRAASKRLLVTLAAILAAASAARAASPLRVTYVTSSTVYVNGGRAEGLAEGMVLKVVRGGQLVAELAVEFVAEHSASCRIVRALGQVQAQDEVVLASATPPPTPTPTPPAEPAPPAPPPAASSSAQVASVQPQAGPAPGRHTQVAGSLTVGSRAVSATGGVSSDERYGRVFLRVADLGGAPLELRVRGSFLEANWRASTAARSSRTSNNRLYELAFLWRPEGERLRLEGGRLTSGPFTAMGYTDGILAQVRLVGGLWFGAFGGKVVDFANSEHSGGRRWGGFFRYAKDAQQGRGFAEVVLGGVSERAANGQPSRDFLTLESRLGGSRRWWVFQRLEVDLNRGWRREVAGSSSQVTNGAFGASLTISQRLRLGASYDQRRNYLTWDTRPLPEEVFLRYFREGGRVSLDWDGPRGWRASLAGGWEKATSRASATNSLYAAISQSRAFGLPLALALDANTYSGGELSGWVANVRTRWYFPGGHDLGLTLGQSLVERKQGTVQRRRNGWARLSGNVQLLRGLYLYGEYEKRQGDDLQGDQGLLELVIRF